VLSTRWITAKLRNRCFFSLSALNAAIAELVAQINNRASRHLGASRRVLFEDLERSALKPLPAEPYVFAEWKECRVALDYHVEIEKHYYSVPHQLLREKVWARIAARTIEVFHRGKRVAAHVRSSSNRKHTTVREHMPSSHRRYADWTPERIRRQAGAIGRHLIATTCFSGRSRPACRRLSGLEPMADPMGLCASEDAEWNLASGFEAQ
jgi:Mu transposase-like protein